MKIMQNIKKVQRAVLHNATLKGNLAAQLKTVAVKAVRGGKDSDDWKKYMAMFADNEAQLQRLLGNDLAAAESWFPETSAYLVSNGVCTTPSGLRFTENIDARIDDGLDTTPGALSATKALDIPDPHPEVPIP
ncbi:MAG TPA: hypothetical protein VGC89_18835 [Pyrinomonadaceae bacterium]